MKVYKNIGPLKSIALSIISAILAWGAFILADDNTLAAYGFSDFTIKAIIIFAYILFVVFMVSSCGNLSVALIKFFSRKKNKCQL